MNAILQERAQKSATDTQAAKTLRILCVSADPSRIARLGSTLATLGELIAVEPDSEASLQEIATSAPSLVFIDFAHADASLLTGAIREAHPGLAVVGLGSESDGDVALRALRAGARDLLDIDATDAASRAPELARRLIARPSVNVSRRGKLTVLLGARVGAGTSTLAANLAVLLQKRLAAQQQSAALLDLGLPASDCALMLDTRGELHFDDAVRNLRRFDETFVNTAFARHSSGLALMTLPADLADMRTVSYATAVKTLDRLRAFFDHQIVDLGGFSNLEFVAQVVDAADDVCLVCDANIASAVSASSLCAALAKIETGEVAASARKKPSLIVNKFDPAVNLAANEIASRLDLPLVAVLPARAQALGRAVNQGQLLAESAPKDPYVRSLDALVTRMTGQAAKAASGSGSGSALARLKNTLLRRG